MRKLALIMLEGTMKLGQLVYQPKPVKDSGCPARAYSAFKAARVE